MDIERSAVPGYEGYLITLDANEQFMLRNPENREDAVIVDTVVAFDPPDGTTTGWVDPEQASAYFVASGIDPTSDQPREIDHQFTDFGVLPPHIKERFPEKWRTDHATAPTAYVPMSTQANKYASTQIRKARWRDERAAGKGVATNQAGELSVKYRNQLDKIPELTVVEFAERTHPQHSLATPPSTPLPTVPPVIRT